MPQLIHTLDAHVALVHDDVALFSYVYNSLAPAIESPRPYFAFHQEYQQAPREILNLNYRIIIADGKWNRERIESIVNRI